MSTFRPWTRQEDDIACRMDLEEKTRKEIGRALGRSHHAVCARLRYLGMMSRESVPTPEMIEDRNVRALLPCRDLTAALFGDPPVGLSALEGRR